MNLTLNQIIDRVNTIHMDGSNNYTKELNNIYNELQKTIMKVDNIIHIFDNKHKVKHKLYTNKNDSVKEVKISTKLTSDLSINAVHVESIENIPDTPLYWVNNINQYAFKLNNTIFRGNIGDIYNKDMIRKNKNTHQITICTHGNLCKTLLSGNICKFYHDPNELKEILDTKITKSIYNEYKLLYRNFMNTSWLHTEKHRNIKNNSMRRFGSRDTLKYDFDLMQINDIEYNDQCILNYKHQCIHDILVIIGLN